MLPCMFIEITITSLLHFLNPGLARRRASYGFHDSRPALLIVHDASSRLASVLHDLLALGAVLREAMSFKVSWLNIDTPGLDLLGLLRVYIWFRLVVNHLWL